MLTENQQKRFKSQGERLIAQTLDNYAIPFIYERPITINDGDSRRTLYPDFYLTGFDIYIEYYGRAGNAAYDRRTNRKQAVYQTNGIRVIPIYPWDLCQDWPANLMAALPTGDPNHKPDVQQYSKSRIGVPYSHAKPSRSYTSSRGY